MNQDPPDQPVEPENQDLLDYSVEPESEPGLGGRAPDHLALGAAGELLVASRIALFGYQVYRPLADDRGVDLVVDLGGGRHAMVQVKSVRKLPGYVFMRKSTFALVPWVAVAVVVFEDGEECPEIFLIPAREWLDPPHPLVDRPYGEGLRVHPSLG